MSATVITSQTSPSQARALAGGKGLNLLRLSHEGFSVPGWAIVGLDAFDAFVRESGVSDALTEALQAAHAGQPLASVSETIRTHLLACAPTGEALATITAAYHDVGAGPVAVRSSGAEEDSPTHSYAGQYASYLNIDGIAAVVEHVVLCWASAYSERCLAYRTHHNLALTPAGVAVIIQQMVRAEKSGVVFTIDPTGPDDTRLVMSSTYGLGEPLVAGTVEPDTVHIDARTGAIATSVVGEKHLRCAPCAGKVGVELIPVTESARAALSVSAQEIADVVREARRIATARGAPQDIEWAIADSQIYILQSRPITTHTPTQQDGAIETERLWDDANIVESFGDLTSPLTFTFARHVYHEVYREYARLLGVPRSQLDQMDPWLGEMLGHFHGRVYYNLFNWYRIVRLVPFYKLNRTMLEFTLGTEPLDATTAQQLKPITGRVRKQLSIRTISAVRFGWMCATNTRAMARFIEHVDRVYTDYDRRDYKGLSAQDIHDQLRSFETKLLRTWGRTIILEQFIGMTYGVLYVLAQRWLPEAPVAPLLFEATRPQELESIAPAESAMRIAEIVERDSDLRALVTQGAVEHAYALVQASDRPAVVALRGEIDRYIDEFGYRSPNELKLEASDLRERPAGVLDIVRQLLDRPATATPSPPANAPAGSQAELHGVRRLVFRGVARITANALATRERIRLRRTRAFGIVRRLMVALGEDLARRGVLETSRDVFYLRTEELQAWLAGTLSHTELRPLVAARKQLELADHAREAPPRFTTRGPIDAQALHASGWRAVASDAESTASDLRELQGMPCSSGTVAGVAHVVDEPTDVRGGILVTYRTDPGWVPVLASAAALLIERGSPLTHVAIIARELGIPTVLQLPGLTRRIRTGMRLSVDGTTGVVRILDPATNR